MELFSQAAGIKMTHIPYKGIAPGVIALISGEVDAIIASSPAVMAQVKAGKARAIAVSSPKPTPLVPGLPAIAESGVPGFTYENWWGVFAPAGTPSNVVNILNASINKALAGDRIALQQHEAAARDLIVAICPWRQDNRHSNEHGDYSGEALYRTLL